MTAGDGKPCIRCGTSEWYSHGACKECAKRRTHKWVQDNPERKREGDRKYRQENLERICDYDRARQEKSRPRHNEASSRYYRRNPKKARAAVKQWEQENRDKVRAYRHARRAREAGANGKYTTEEWRRLCDHYGGKCLACGRSDRRLTPDHVVPISQGGANTIDNIQPLCLSCNQSKNAKTIDYRA